MKEIAEDDWKCSETVIKVFEIYYEKIVLIRLIITNLELKLKKKKKKLTFELPS